MSSKKLLIIGFPEAGKTCIKKAFFDGEDPEKLMSDLGAPEPTLGVQFYTFSWIDTAVGIVDSSGQEMERFLFGDESDKEMTFGSTDVIIFVFDINNWEHERENVLKNLANIKNTRDDVCPLAKLYAFCHKIDLIAENFEERADKYKNIKTSIQEDMKIRTIFTSIDPKFIHTLFRSMQIILNELSEKGISLEHFLKELPLKEESEALILLDDKFNVVNEKRSRDISVLTMYNFIMFVKLFDKSLRRINSRDLFEDGFAKSRDGIQILMKSGDDPKYRISYIIAVSKQDPNILLKKYEDFIELSS